MTKEEEISRQNDKRKAREELARGEEEDESRGGRREDRRGRERTEGVKRGSQGKRNEWNALENQPWRR